MVRATDFFTCMKRNASIKRGRKQQTVTHRRSPVLFIEGRDQKTADRYIRPPRRLTWKTGLLIYMHHLEWCDFMSNVPNQSSFFHIFQLSTTKPALLDDSSFIYKTLINITSQFTLYTSAHKNKIKKPNVSSANMAIC